MSTRQGDFVDRIVNAALADIEKHAPREFQQLQADPAKKQALNQALREAAEEEVKLAEEFRTEHSENIAERLSKYLPQHRVELIQTGLQVPTYRLNISKKADGHHWVDITRDGKMFMQPQMLDSIPAIRKSTYIQIASIVVEGALLTLQAIGVHAAPNEQLIKSIAEKILSVLESSSDLQKAVEVLEEAVNSGSKWKIAKAIFNLIKESNSCDILWNVIKGLCSNMSKLDWIKTAGTVSLMIIAACGTDGAALIAKIAVAIISAKEFLEKVKNLEKLATLEKELKV